MVYDMMWYGVVRYIKMWYSIVWSDIACYGMYVLGVI